MYYSTATPIRSPINDLVVSTVNGPNERPWLKQTSVGNSQTVGALLCSASVDSHCGEGVADRVQRLSQHLT